MNRADCMDKGCTYSMTRVKVLLGQNRHDPRPTLHGMRVTPELERWVRAPRKWISITTWSGQDFVVEEPK